MLREYVPPVTHKINHQMVDLTCSLYGAVSANVIGTDGYTISVLFNQFPVLVAAVEQFQYFEITGFKIDGTLNKDVATYYSGSLVYRPINYVIGEVPSTTAPSGPQQLMELPGAVWLQQGTTNKGQWQVPTSKQVYSTRAAVTGGNAAGNILYLIDNVGAAERAGSYVVYLNVKLYGKQYSTTASLLNLPFIAQKSQAPISMELTTPKAMCKCST
jgi:hypothetical protein